MTLRRKFIFALLGMVVFMAVIFAAISLFSMQSLSGKAVKYIQQGYTQQWNRLLTNYYSEHGSWDGVEEYIQRVMANPNPRFPLIPRDNERLLVFDVTENVVGSSMPADIGKSLDQVQKEHDLEEDQLVPILIRGRTAGYSWVDEKQISHQGRLERDISSSFIRAMLIGLLATAFLALILGILLTRRFTVPLRKLTEAVKEVGEGNLTPRLEIKGTDDLALLGSAFNQMTGQLARNEEVRRNMVADIAHELRTPLSIVSGKLESIQEGVLQASPENLLPIQDEVIRLSRLVSDLQQLSLAEAGKLPLNLREIDLRKLISKIIEMFNFEFEEREITVSITGVPPTLTADHDRLTQVFVNLLGNALMHTPQGGEIKVIFTNGENPGEQNPQQKARFTELKGHPGKQEGKNFWVRVGRKQSKIPAVKQVPWIRVIVEDSGEGIGEENIQHIFDRFYRVDKARERETGGTGLGLAIAREFVQAHGGTIEVESKVGEGSRFSVWLPVKSPVNQSF